MGERLTCRSSSVSLVAASLWSFLLLLLAGRTAAECNTQINNKISDKLIRYGALVVLDCPVSANWWKSRSCANLDSFSPHDGCTDQQSCHVTTEDYMNGDLFYCCTDDTQSAVLLPLAIVKCFQISICPNITMLSTPPFLLAGTTEKIHISVTTAPGPPTLLDESNFLTTLINDEEVPVPYTPYIVNSAPRFVMVYEFRVPEDPEISEVSLQCIFRTTNGFCTDAYKDVVISIVHDATGYDPSPTTTTAAATTGTTSMPTSEPTTDCVCQGGGRPLLGVGTGLGVLVFLLATVLSIAIAQCLWRRGKWTKGSGNSSTDGFPSPLYDTVADYQNPPYFGTVQVQQNQMPSGPHPTDTYIPGMQSNADTSSKPPRPENGRVYSGVRFLHPQPNSKEALV